MKRVILPALLLLAALTGRAFAADASKTVVTAPSGARFTAEIFDTPESRQRGLMFRESMKPDGAALFIFDQPGRWGFWMKNCRFAIDIIWLDPQRRVVDVKPKAPPCSDLYCPVYAPSRDASYVVEFPAGTADRTGIVPGAKLRFRTPPPLTPAR